MLRELSFFLKKENSGWYVISIGLAILFIFSPAGQALTAFFTFVFHFFHEMGHAFFAFLAGDNIVIIDISQATTYSSIPSNLLLLILFYTGGSIFTTLLVINLALLLYFTLKQMNQKIQASHVFGYETVSFHFIMILIIYQVFELLANLIPVEIAGGKSDMAKLLNYGLNIPFVISEEKFPFLLLLYFLVTASSLILNFLFLGILFSNIVFCVVLYITQKYAINERILTVRTSSPTPRGSLKIIHVRSGVIVIFVLLLLIVYLFYLFPLNFISVYLNYLDPSRPSGFQDMLIRLVASIVTLMLTLILIRSYRSWKNNREWGTDQEIRINPLLIDFTVVLNNYGSIYPVICELSINSEESGTIYENDVEFGTKDGKFALPRIRVPSTEKLKIIANIKPKDDPLLISLPVLSSMGFKPTNLILELSGEK